MSEGTGESDSLGGDSLRTAQSETRDPDAPTHLTEEELQEHQREQQERQEEEDRIAAANAAAFAADAERNAGMDSGALDPTGTEPDPFSAGRPGLVPAPGEPKGSGDSIDAQKSARDATAVGARREIQRRQDALVEGRFQALETKMNLLASNMESIIDNLGKVLDSKGITTPEAPPRKVKQEYDPRSLSLDSRHQRELVQPLNHYWKSGIPDISPGFDTDSEIAASWLTAVFLCEAMAEETSRCDVPCLIRVLMKAGAVKVFSSSHNACHRDVAEALMKSDSDRGSFAKHLATRFGLPEQRKKKFEDLLESFGRAWVSLGWVVGEPR